MSDQQPPKGDNRYRIHRSEKCYVADYCGSEPGRGTWYISDSVERVVYRFPDGSLRVQYRNRFYVLQPPEDLVNLAKEHWKAAKIGGGGPVIVGGRAIYAHNRTRRFEPFPFIVISV